MEGLKDQETHGPNSMRNNAVLSSSSANIVASEESESGDLAAPETNVTTPVGDGRVYSQQADTSASSTSHQYPIQSSSPQSLSSDVQATLAERRQRLEADQKRREAQALAKRKAKARAQQEEAASKASQDPARAGQLSHAQQQRKRQQEARQERERILKIIENDKVERRHRLELQREYSHAETSKSDTNAQNMSQSAQFQAGTRFSNSAKECALLIRLFDGRSLRSSFPASQNLHTHVRVWVDRERSDGDAPYSFKQVLAPNNNHAIEISEEMESLQALGLVPNATLLMVPAKGASTAYVAGTDRGLATKAAASFSRIGTAVSVFLVSFWLAVTSTLWTYLGIGTRPAPPGHQGGAERASESSVVEEQSDHQAKASGVAITRNVWTLRDQDARKDDQQFYNGNQVLDPFLLNRGLWSANRTNSLISNQERTSLTIVASKCYSISPFIKQKVLHRYQGLYNL